ncbi:MAG: glycosyltransferase family 4 protein [Lentilitoribacter sp.]
MSLKNLIRVYFWRRLPSFVREAIMNLYINRLNIRISTKAEATGPIIIVGLLSQPSGLGTAARACYNALHSKGVEVYGIDVTNLFLHEPQSSKFVFRDGSQLFGTGTLIVHVSGDRFNYVLNKLGQEVLDKKHILAHWFWEFESLPASWKSVSSKVHGICVNSDFVARAVSKIEKNKPIYKMPYPIQECSKPKTTEQKVGKKKFVVTTIFNMSSNFYRKNPCGVVSAFQKAFGTDDQAELLVKVSNSDSWAIGRQMLVEAIGNSKNIRLIDEMLSEEQLNELYEKTDVVISMHRSEGLGLILIEAMSRYIPVISTGWSATSEFVTEETGFPVSSKLIKVDDPHGTYTLKNMFWAEPNIDEAAQILTNIRQNPDVTVQKCKNAVQHLRKYHSAEKYVEEIHKIMN